MHTMYLRRCAKCGALRRKSRLLGFVKTDVELVCKLNSPASETRDPRGILEAPMPSAAKIAESVSDEGSPDPSR